MEKIREIRVKTASMAFLRILLEKCLDESHELERFDAARHIDKALLAVSAKQTPLYSPVADIIDVLSKKLDNKLT